MADALKDSFEDPELKSAVHRCWACDCAPAELREKIVNLFRTAEPPARAGADVEPHSHGNPLRIPRSTWVLSAAAIIVLVFGLSFRFWGSSKPAVVAVNIPVSLQTDLVARHDECCAHTDHQHLSVPRNNDAAIADALRTKLNRPVLVARPFDPGWTFRGASICPVGTVPSGHLVFSRDGDTLSVFSLPKSVALSVKDGEEFASTSGGHAIAGFAKDGAIFCLVGNSPAKTFSGDELQQMRTQMENDVTVATLPGHVASDRAEFAELLETHVP